MFKTPIFMIGELLAFLNVGNELGAPFITYFEHSFKMFCSKHYIIVRHNKQKKEVKTPITDAKELTGYYNR